MLFTSAELFKVSGKADGGDCQAALDQALAEVAPALAKDGLTDTLGLYDAESRDGWALVKTVTCKQKGKPEAPRKSTVTLEVLATRAGQGDAWPTVTGPRGLALVRALVVGDSMAGTQVRAIDLVAHAGSIHLRQETTREDTVPMKARRNRRAWLAFHEDASALLQGGLDTVVAFDELSGVTAAVTVIRQKKTTKDGATTVEQKSEVLEFAVSAADIRAFADGELTEQELLDRGTVTQVVDGKRNRFEVDVAAAAD